MRKSDLIRIERFARQTLAKGEVAHDFIHVDRVRRWALKIAWAEDYPNIQMVEVAALLHDIGLAQCHKRSEHGEVGAKMVRKYLIQNKFFNDEEIKKICLAVEWHCRPYTNYGILVDIIRDADILDLLGAVGIIRAFRTQGQIMGEYDPKYLRGVTWQYPHKYFTGKLNKNLPIGKFLTDQLNFQLSCFKTMKTKTGRKLAKFQFRYMQNYLVQLEKEIKQK